ncbi:vWA domain-containing protein [Alteromonas sp. BMJM2]|uniref:vWA domain-containing protein n=1 Tax=Alteromonas sp. BMJM2 TaxID=2954241 RepID=UPI002F96D9BE
MINTEFLNNLHFIRPEWFFSAIPLLVLYVWLRTRTTKHTGWQAVIPAHLYKHMIVGKVEKGKRPPLWLLPFTWFFAVVALAGPTWERLPQPVYQLKMGHVVVLDMSMSMRATDMTPDRLTRAKYKAIDLVNKISEGEMGLVAYAGDAFVISPLTEDAANITSLLPSLSPEIMPVPGSDPLLGIEAANDLLTNAGFTNGAIYWITDGIEFGQQQELQEYVSGIPFKVNALTVGTAQGAPIRQLNGELLKDTSGSIVIPKLKEDVVRGVIKASGGQLESFTSNDDDIEALSATSLLERDTNDSTEGESNPSGDQWKEVGPYLVLLILPFAAFAFRRGLLFFIVVGVLAPFDNQIAQAQTSEEPVQNETRAEGSLSWWQTPFLNADQEGLNSYQQEQFTDAAEQFEDTNWKASSLYKAGRFEEALAAYQKVPGTDSLYNQGNALAKLGKLEAAIEKYSEVLERQPDFEDAKANRALLEELINQQQEQEQQNQEQKNQDSEQQDGEQSQDSQSQENQAEQGQEKGEQSQDSESKNNSDNENGAEQQSSEQNQSAEQSQSSEQSQQQNRQQQSDEQTDSEESIETGEQSENVDQSKQEQTGAQDESGGFQAQQEPLTDAEKEEMQRMENLMRRVPDDPAFLLKRKMQLEAEKRKRQRMPSNRRDW